MIQFDHPKATKNGKIKKRENFENFFHIFLRFCDSRYYNKSYVDALWQWRRVKTSTETIGQSLQKEFLDAVFIGRNQIWEYGNFSVRKLIFTL